MMMKGKISNALRYAASDWYNVFLLGIILFLVDHIVDLNDPSLIEGFDIIILIVVFLLSFIEVGYGFRIVEETVMGSSKPPSFHHPGDLFWHGVKESVILLVYFIVPLILVIMGVSEFEYFLNMDLSPIIMRYALLFAIIFFIAFNIMFQGAVLNMAHHGGSIISGFNIPQIFRKIRLVGLKNMILISFITIIVIYILKQAIFDSLHALPYFLPYVNISVGDVISTVFIAPVLIIFTTRLVGLVDVEEKEK